MRVRERRKRQIFIDVFPGQFPSAQFGLNLKCPWTVPLQTAKPVTAGTESTGSRRQLWEESWGPRQPRGPLPSPAPGRLAHVLRWDADICLPPSPCSFPLAPPHGSTPVRRRLQMPSQPDASTEHLIKTLAGPSSSSIRTVLALLPHLSHHTLITTIFCKAAVQISWTRRSVYLGFPIGSWVYWAFDKQFLCEWINIYLSVWRGTFREGHPFSGADQTGAGNLDSEAPLFYIIHRFLIERHSLLYQRDVCSAQHKQIVLVKPHQ